MKHLSRTLTQLVLLATLLVLAACGTSSATPTAAPAVATATTEAATATPEPATAAEPVSSTESISPTESVEMTGTTTVSATTPVSGTAEAISDPFAYCAAVGNADVPAAPYEGEATPESVASALQTAMGTDMPLDVLSNGMVWRCMDNKVYACSAGANLPCTEKADSSETPTQAELDFCADAANTNAEAIPAVVTGRATVFSWRCTDGKPAVIEQVFQVDAQGFIAEIWYELPTP